MNIAQALKPHSSPSCPHICKPVGTAFVSFSRDMSVWHLLLVLSPTPCLMSRLFSQTTACEQKGKHREGSWPAHTWT